MKRAGIAVALAVPAGACSSPTKPDYSAWGGTWSVVADSAITCIGAQTGDTVLVFVGIDTTETSDLHVLGAWRWFSSSVWGRAIGALRYADGGTNVSFWGTGNSVGSMTLFGDAGPPRLPGVVGRLTVPQGFGLPDSFAWPGCSAPVHAAPLP